MKRGRFARNETRRRLHNGARPQVRYGRSVHVQATKRCKARALPVDEPSARQSTAANIQK